MYGGNYFAQPYFGQGYPALPAGIPIWVSPANHATGVNQTDPLVFLIPESSNPIHFELQIDTVDTFDSGDLQGFNSMSSQVGWEYYNGSSWVSVPADGIPLGYSGNQARYMPQTEIATGTWYRRIRGRIRL